MPKSFPDPSQTTIEKHPEKWFIRSSVATTISLVLIIIENTHLFGCFLFGGSISILLESLFLVSKEKLSNLLFKK